ncbi:DUF7159 family protein [Mycolicibacterium mengxianglii]|uniref:DUF7159 family protein n=1 Tax=Mycolicibacterium mengxianglii TaxID=2736649 RepID=UPI0018D0B81D|nr:hypothetical protein [Mycolicibacterium mengxianglii]
MDIVLGVSMTPTTVRMVLVEGAKADGVTVDHDVFDIPAGDPSATAPDRVVAAILGTRESAVEGGHQLVGTGVTWRDHAEAAALRDALAARNIDDVMLVSELHAAGALAQAVGKAVGYERTALMFLERNTATLSVVETADGSIVKVQRHDLHTTDAVAEMASMVAGLESLESPPQGVFVVGSGVAVGAIKLQLESATSLPVSAPDEPEVALARGAALASANAPLFEASTVGLAYSEGGVDGTTAGAALAGLAAADVTQAAGADYTGAPAALAYSDVDPESQAFPVYAEPEPQAVAAQQQERKPFLLVGSALTSIFVLGVTALVISLAVSIRPTVDQRPAPAERAIVPTQVRDASPATPEAAVPPAPAPPPETIKAPVPVVQQAPQPQSPRTVFVEKPAPAAAPAPAAPAPAPAPAAPAPAPAAPPVVAPVVPAPVVVPPPIIQLPAPRLPSIFRPPWEPPRNNWPDWTPPRNQPEPDDDWTPPWRPTQTQQPRPPMVTVAPAVPDVPRVPQVPQVQQPQAPQVQWPGSGSGSGERGSSGDRGGPGGSGGPGSSGRGSGNSGGSGPSGGGLLPVWPFN